MSFELITLKLLIGFVGLWAMTRFLGKKEISQLTPFDFVSSLMLSELVGNTVYQEDVKFSHLLYSLVLWALLSYILEKITQYFKRSRAFLDGKASILIRHGEVDLKEMRKNSLDFDQLRMLLRQSDVFFMNEVAYAIFEANGTLSVMKRSDFDNVSRADLNLPQKDAYFAYSLVEDGKIDPEGLKWLGKDEAWLRERLSESGYTDLKDVAYAEWKEDEGLYVLEHRKKSFKMSHVGTTKSQ
ncbi:uncharacterized membrane protein YcaP (DUF421 family) [Paenibacillus shirakamiensis]|uniref:Uncharacterized membrane protein YcaP (DUF421 family) n=1 Tax=Paenibacillus shirakamiensis TaxID=1265935 RepID=A0ABS4JIT8_9BACL|nr:DUF421 domain-containing protein [Paenibacillus shirakamiensis]MBP2001613.1 uncharacterized membrane protein YcaP (DUF421 family) [Paenibacillus shirakamiensis]